MPAGSGRFGDVSPRERIPALVAAAVVQAALALALLSGLRVSVGRAGEVLDRLIEIPLPPPPPATLRPKPARTVPDRAAPQPRTRTAGASPGPTRATVAPIVARAAPAPATGGGSGAGASTGAGTGGGGGGQGEGDGGDDGGTDLVQIAGAILPSDYPRDLRSRGIGGHVGVLFTVGSSGRVTACSVTRSSGVPELDALTCRLIRERFVYRPSTDSRGRPIADEVEGEHDWVAAGRN